MKSATTIEVLPGGRESAKTHEKKHTKWKNTLQFTCCCISATVGFGNIWRFPYVAAKNGGTVFLFCYFIVALLVGIPLFYLEAFLGQFSSKSNAQVFKALAPAFAGIGWCQVLASVSISTYYGGVITYMVFYFVQSFSSVLPWTECRKAWGVNCITLANVSKICSEGNYRLSEELYFNKEVLRLGTQMKNRIGLPNLYLVICSVFTWLANFVLLSHGIEWLGSASHFLAGFPYFVICVLLGRATRFEGAYSGIQCLFHTTWRSIFSPKVWYEATFHCLYSLGQGIGAITALASYNKFGCRIKFISGTVVFINTITNVLLGMTTFSVLGHLATQRNVTIDDIPNQGPGLVFISYAQALSTIKSVPNLFSAMFYFMLIVVSLGSLLGVQLVVIDHLHYCFPVMKYWHLAMASSIFCFVLSTVYLTPTGMYLIELVSTYGHAMVLVLLITFIVIAAIIAYGLQNISWDVEYMSQEQFSPYWRVLWAIVEPALLITITMYTFIAIKPLCMYSTYSQVFAWILFLGIILPIPLRMLYEIGHAQETEGVRAIVREGNWRPYNDEHYEEWQQLKSAAKKKILEQNDPRLVRFFKSLLRMYD